MSVYQMNKETIEKAKEFEKRISIKIDNISEIIKNTIDLGGLTVVGSRPGIGKTYFLINIIAKMIKQGKQVAYISLETGGTQIVDRVMLLFNNEKELENSNLIIDDTAPFDIDKIFSIDYLNDVELVVIDYLQLINFSLNANVVRRNSEYIIKILKQLSIKKNIPVLVSTQLLRIVDERNDKRPTIFDIPISDEARDYIDNFIMLYKDYYYMDDFEESNILKSYVLNAKNNTVTDYRHNIKIINNKV